MKVLLVDDDADTVELYREHFTAAGFEVHAAATAADCIRTSPSGSFQSITMTVGLS